MANVAELKQKWNDNCEGYKTKEIGSGVHSFIGDLFESADFFGLTKSATNTGKNGIFVNDTEANAKGRPDFVLYIDKDVIIPVEAKCFTRITEGESQIARYQVGLNKQFGILTDGWEWRFYRGSKYQKLTWDKISEHPEDLKTFWQEYLRPENYYIELFNPSGQMQLFEDKLDLNDPENRKTFFEDTTNLIRKFKTKMKAVGAWDLASGVYQDKIAVETSYAYLIQFILYKVLVDNKYAGLKDNYDRMMRVIAKSIADKDFYNIIIGNIKEIAEYISNNVYYPFKKEQESITEKLASKLSQNLTIDDISPWLDILVYINRYDFSNLKNEIFGFIYENYLKDLYEDKNKGQYFTDPAVVNFMLKEMGYTEAEIKKRSQRELSLIDPSCGAGTFLYSAVDRIINAFYDDTEAMSKHIEDIIDKNIFGLDIEEFPLYLAEMSMLMRLLPMIINQKFTNPIDNKFKLFKTKDSISEFLDIGIDSKPDEKLDLFSHIKETALDYPSFMRDEKDLEEMMKSLPSNGTKRSRFDFVIGNPPYIGYNDCCRQGVSFTKLIKDKNNSSISLGNVYGMNLHSVPNNPKKYAPKPNLYAFFIALGLGLLKENGKLCYIIPQTILTETDYDVLRYHLSKFTTIDKIITFEGNLFINRGLKQTKPVATSSLIFVLTKHEPQKDHMIKVVNYKAYTDKQGVDFETYFNSHNKTIKYVSQEDLVNHVENWGSLKQSNEFMHFKQKYDEVTDSLATYYNHKISELVFGTKFYFDAGFTLDKTLYSSIAQDGMYNLGIIMGPEYVMKQHLYYPKSALVKVPQGSQGPKCLLEKYRIIWKKTYRGDSKFTFSDISDLMLDSGYQFISSNNRKEILYLQALLNSKLSNFVLEKMLRLGNEKMGIFVVIKRLKNFIRIPKITSENRFIKDEVIRATDQMLALEEVKLQDIVNLNQIQMQKFDSVSVNKAELILGINGSKPLCVSIPSDKIKAVSDAIQNHYYDKKGNMKFIEITLSDLRNIPVIDFEYQNQLKDYIDDLVFALYFNVPVSKIGLDFKTEIKTLCQQNEFYDYINHDKIM